MAVTIVDRLHHQRVGDEDAVVAPGATQQVTQDLLRQSRRVFGIQLRIHDVRGHHRWRFLAQRMKRQQLERGELRFRLVDHRQIKVRVDLCIAVAGEVFDATGNPLAQRAAHPCACQPRHLDRVRAKTTITDDWIGRVVVDIEHRREIPVAAQAAHAARDCRANLLGKRRIGRGPQRHRRGSLRQKGRTNDGAAFLIECNQCLRSEHGTQLRSQLLDLAFGAQVLAEQAHGTDVVAPQEFSRGSTQLPAFDIDHHQSARMKWRAHRHLIAPSMPRMNKRCVKKNTISTGSTVRIAPAATTRVELPKVPDSSRMPTASGIKSLLVNTTLGHRKLFHVETVVRITSVPICGSANGSMICSKMRNSDAPSTRAASSRSCGTSSNAFFIMKMPIAPASVGRITPACVLTRRNCEVVMKLTRKLTSVGSMSVARIAPNTSRRPRNFSRASGYAAAEHTTTVHTTLQNVIQAEFQ